VQVIDFERQNFTFYDSLDELPEVWFTFSKCNFYFQVISNLRKDRLIKIITKFLKSSFLSGN